MVNETDPRRSEREMNPASERNSDAKRREKQRRERRHARWLTGLAWITPITAFFAFFGFWNHLSQTASTIPARTSATVNNQGTAGYGAGFGYDSGRRRGFGDDGGYGYSLSGGQAYGGVQGGFPSSQSSPPSFFSRAS